MRCCYRTGGRARTVPVRGGRPRAFTLVELVVTVLIVSIIALMAVPVGQLVSQRMKEQELRAALWEIREAIDAYKQAFDEGRIARASGASGYPPSLRVLVDGVEDAGAPDKRRIYFLRRIPRDPFAPAHLPPEETWGKRSYTSAHDAPREGEDIFDVYSKSPRTGLNGIAHRDW